MKILIVSQYFWPENFRINDLAAGLVERGHKVSVLTGIPNYPDGKFFPGYGIFKKRREEYKGFASSVLHYFQGAGAMGYDYLLTIFPLLFFASILAPFLCREKFDLVFVYEPSPITVGLPSIVLKKLKSVPMFFWVQDLWPESLSATGAISSKSILNMMEKMVCFIYRYCDRILIQSPAFSSSIESQGVDSERINFFPNSIEAIYKPVSKQPNLEIKNQLPSGFRIMFAGNIGAAQDFETILLAAEKLKEYSDIHFLVLGDGRRFEWVKEEIGLRNLTGNVHLLGRHPFETMPVFFAQADVMLVTLKQDPIFARTIPAKIQSYMACGKPIVAALDGEGERVIIESGSGVASPSGDAGGTIGIYPGDVSNAKQALEAMGLRAKEYCDANFEREMLIDKLEGWMLESVQHNYNNRIKV